MYLSLIILGIIILATLLTAKDKDPFYKSLDSKEHPLKILYPLASRIYALFLKGGREGLFGGTDALREIYVDEKPEISLKKQGCKCLASILAVIAVTAFICFAYSYSKESLIIDGNGLKRNGAGSGTRRYSLVLNSEMAENDIIEIDVSERQLEGEDFEKLKSDVKQYLDIHVLGKNGSRECVKNKLELIETIPGTSVTIKWAEENSWFVAVDGSLKNEEFETPVRVILSAELSYYEKSWDYEIGLTIYPPDVTEKDLFEAALYEQLEEADEETINEEMFRLPGSVDGIALSWTEEEDNTVRNFFLLGLLAIGIIFPSMKRDIKKKQKERSDQMIKDYPDIVSKFIMLVTAGMTCRAAWDKICRDYLRTREKGSDMKYAYEEMLISNREMQLGIPEIKVYERFGVRCSVPVYNRFGNMLARNIKRGSASIIEILESEAKESFAERRENVRKKGEETGTKLLIPMFGMLILVIAIVVVPAFTSFSF